MIVPQAGAISVAYNNTTFYFCSQFCKDRFLQQPGVYWKRYSGGAVQNDKASRRIAYFSMEAAIAAAIPTYAGGLGVLAGDTLRSFADLRVPAVGVTLLYRKGYFRQSIDDSGFQQEHAADWDVARVLQPWSETIEVSIENRPVKLPALTCG
jgi:starch phosphorylase